MKRLIQFLLAFSLGGSALALWGLGRVWVGYSIGEAFNDAGIFRTPENFEAEHQIRLWGSYLLAAACVTLLLFMTYRKNYGRQRK